MRIVCLVENTQGASDCLFEHGLCVYVETEQHKLLMDCGSTDSFMKNAELLGIDLCGVDTVILSHGHYDHSGGIMPFAGKNPSAQIYMQQTAGGDYYSIREEGETYIGIDKAIQKLPQLVCVDGDMDIDEELFLFSGITGKRFPAKSNQRLKRREGDVLLQDDFRHEQCLVIRQGDRHVLLSGCAHNGILNILDRYEENFGDVPDIVISGFHMMQNEYSEEDLENIRSVARELAALGTVFYTGHCTGEVAYATMKEIMGEQLVQLHSGKEICV